MHICRDIHRYIYTLHRQTDMYALIHIHPCAHMHACMCIVVLENQAKIAYDKKAFRHSAAPTAVMKFAELWINLS